MRKAIAILLSLMMVVGMLAGCSGDNGGTTTQNPGGSDTQNPGGNDTPGGDVGIPLDGSWPEETVKIGVATFNPTDESFISLMEYFDYLAEHFNVEFVVSEALDSAEQEFAFIDNCASAGCYGIFAYFNTAGAQSIKQATSQGMYYWGMEQYYEEVADDPYYLGAYTLKSGSGSSAKDGNYLAGYQLGLAMGNAGLKHIAYCNGGASFGVQMFVDRQAGFFDGFAEAQANGSTTIFDPATDVIEGFPGTDAFSAAQSAALSGDYDGVCASMDAFSWFQPILDSGKDFKVGCIGSVSDTYKTFVDNGTVIALVYECPELMFGAAVVNMINAATGHMDLTRGADGKPLLNPTQRWLLDSPEAFNVVYETRNVNGQFFITAEDIASVLGGINPDATTDDIMALFNVPIESIEG